MKKYLILAAIVFNIILISCNKKKPQPIKLAKINTQKLLIPGEWLSDKDSLSGISIRENKMAFFKNMEFKSEDIYEYELIDSIYKFSDSEDIVREYILAKDYKDTIYYQIISKSENSLILKVNKQPKTFNLKKKAN
jgi:hypothetical protein